MVTSTAISAWTRGGDQELFWFHDSKQESWGKKWFVLDHLWPTACGKGRSYIWFYSSWMHSSDLVPPVMSMGWSNLCTGWKFGFIGIFDIDYEQSSSNWFEFVTKEVFDPHRVLWQTSHTDQFISRKIWQVVSNNIRGMMCFSQSVCTVLTLNPYQINGQKYSVLEVLSTTSILLAKFYAKWCFVGTLLKSSLFTAFPNIPSDSL